MENDLTWRPHFKEVQRALQFAGLSYRPQFNMTDDKLIYAVKVIIMVLYLEFENLPYIITNYVTINYGSNAKLDLCNRIIFI